MFSLNESENKEIAKAKATEAKIIAEAEEAKKAEEERSAQEVAVASEPAYTEPVVNEVVEQAAPVQARTDGFNFNGRHFDIAWFSGSGQVPADSYVYRWSNRSQSPFPICSQALRTMIMPTTI